MNHLKKGNWFLSIAVIIPVMHLLLFVYLPSIIILYDSFFSKTYTKTKGFVGLDNYITIFKSKELIDAILRSRYYIFAGCFQIMVGIVLAGILVKKAKLSGLFKGVLFFPYMINSIAIGYMFKSLYIRGGALDIVLQSIGVKAENIPYWLRSQTINNFSVAFASVWRYTGYSMVIFIGAIASIDQALYDAAKVDGASGIQEFLYITIPSIRKIIALNLSLTLISALSEFDMPFTVASEGANRTSTFMIEIYKMAHVSKKVGLASAMVVILIITMLILTLICVKAMGLASDE